MRYTAKSKSDESAALTIIGVVLFAIAILVISYIGYGIVLSILWRWFIVSTFGLPELGIPQAIGLSITVSMLTSGLEREKSDDDESFKVKLFKVALRLLLPLLVGWIVLQFM